VGRQSRTSGSETGEQGGRLHLVVAAPASSAPPVLELRGEFDLDTVPQIDRFLRRRLGPLYHQQHLVIDLERTTFVDSSFVAFLVRLVNDQRAKRKELVLARPHGQVRRVVALVGLHNIVPVFESVDEAVGALVSGTLPVIPPAFRAARFEAS
jgi:anti-sigma B factor antagonist